MTNQEQIKYFFKELPAPDQEDLIAELQCIIGGISVIDFALLVQRIYKKSITFDIRTDIVEGKPSITAICIAPYGEFSATANNQKIAKNKAVQKAFERLNNIKNQNS